MCLIYRQISRTLLIQHQGTPGWRGWHRMVVVIFDGLLDLHLRYLLKQGYHRLLFFGGVEAHCFDETIRR